MDCECMERCDGGSKGMQLAPDDGMQLPPNTNCRIRIGSCFYTDAYFVSHEECACICE
jgi:hypothetical protein